MTRTCLLQSLPLGLPRSPGRSPQLRRLLLNTGNATVKKPPTEEPNNTKNSKRKAYSKQQSSTEKETKEQSWMKESGRRKTGQSEYLKTTDEYFKNRRRILQKTATGEGSSDDEIEDGRLQNISDIFYSRIKEIGVRTG